MFFKISLSRTKKPILIPPPKQSMHQPLHLRANKENGKSSDDKGNAPRAQPNGQKALAKANIKGY